MTKKISVFFLGAGILIICGSILLFPNISAKAVSEGMRLCTDRVIPSLFPFMVISSFITASNMLKSSKGVFLFMSRLLGISYRSAGAMILGCFCGSPLGAAMISEEYTQGRISREEAERMMPVCNMASPAFIIAFAENAFPHMAHPGVILWLIQLLSSVLLLIFTRNGKEKRKDTRTEARDKGNGTDYVKALLYSLIKAVKTSANICGTVIFFCFLNSLLSFWLEKFAFLKVPLALMGGICEITYGMTHLKVFGDLGFSAAALFICFGGLSVAMQTKGIISDRLSAKGYIAKKLFTGISGAAMAYGYMRICGYS